MVMVNADGFMSRREKTNKAERQREWSKLSRKDSSLHLLRGWGWAGGGELRP